MVRVKAEAASPPTLIPAEELLVRLEPAWGAAPKDRDAVLHILAEALSGTPITTLHDCYRWDLQVPGLGSRFLGYEASGLSHCISSSLPPPGTTIQHEGKTFFIASHRQEAQPSHRQETQP